MTDIEPKKLLELLKNELDECEKIYINNPDDSEFTRQLIEYCNIKKLDLSISGEANKRVYLIDRERLKDAGFREPLVAAIKLQTEIGVSVGVQFISELKSEQKQDFILYDDFVVLVEEKQANSDYSFGKSTAYFSKNKLDYYSDLFDSVWSGYIGSGDPRTRIKELNLGS